METEQPVRVNTKISARANKWLNVKSAEMAISKSALINIAIESYIKEVEVVHGLPRLVRELEKHGIKIDSI